MLGLSSNKNFNPKPWYFDSSTSNHMTNATLPLTNIQKYDGDLQIYAIYGDSLHIIDVVDISASLNNVFVFPKFSTIL